MITKLLVLAVAAAGQFDELSYLFPDQLLSQANGPPSMCGLSASSTDELANAVRGAHQFTKAKIESSSFEIYDTSDHMQEFVITRAGNPAHPAVACREFKQVNGELVLSRSMNCSGDHRACNELFINFRTLDSQVKSIPTDNQLSLP